MSSPKNALKLIGFAELAQELGVGPWTIRRWIANGDFPRPLHLIDSGHSKWRVKDVEAFLEKRRVARRRRPAYRGAVKQQREATDA